MVQKMMTITEKINRILEQLEGLCKSSEEKVWLERVCEEAAKKPSLFSKLKGVVFEHYNESNIKNKATKVTEAFSKKAKKPSSPKKEEGKKEFKNLPPI